MKKGIVSFRIIAFSGRHEKAIFSVSETSFFLIATKKANFRVQKNRFFGAPRETDFFRFS